MVRRVHNRCNEEVFEVNMLVQAMLHYEPLKRFPVIDDVVGCFFPEHAARGEAVAPVVLSLFGRPNDAQESLPLATPSCPSQSSSPTPTLGHRNSRSSWGGSSMLAIS